VIGNWTDNPTMCNSRMRWRPWCLALGLSLLLGACVSAQSTNAKLPGYEGRQVFIPMRDGVKLCTQIYAPRGQQDRLPIILTRSPYGILYSGKGTHPILRAAYRELATERYIFVFQTIRGRFNSGGKFVMLRPPRDKHDPHSIDESTDTYDTIDWLVKNVPGNNGRVGMLGVSYDGWLTVMAMLDPHPALKAVSPQASPADMFLGDDFHHNGAFRLSYGLEYVALMERTKGYSNFRFDRHDTFDWYLDLGPLSNINRRYFHNKVPTWNDFVRHPNYDAFWQKQAFAPYLDRVTVPTLNVAGWWDQEDFYGPLKIYELLEQHDTNHMNYLVVGPWNHGGWSGTGRALGPVEFGSDTSKYYREKIQAPWFAYFLKDKGELTEPKALTFQTGSNRWVRHNHWPPESHIQKRPLYFRADRRLSFEKPEKTTEPAFDRYISDPACPVPYRPRPVSPTYPGPEWRTWLLQDQRFVDSRPDVLNWQTEPLKEDLVISGDILADLFASTTGTDSDWVVKLIDVYPETFAPKPAMGGYQLIVADEVLRGRYRHSFVHPEPLTANKVEEYKIDLHTNEHCFQKGHRIMVQVQSTWFPLIDRNPQKYVENIFKAQASDFQRATQRVYRSPDHPSHIDLPVAGK
jgi:uncharacterized protein